MWTAKYHVWHGSIAPPFYLQEVRSGPWTLASSWWKTQQSQSTASRFKMLTSMTKGPMSAQSSQTRNQNPQKCISSFKVRPVILFSDNIYPDVPNKGWWISIDVCMFCCTTGVHLYRWIIVNPCRFFSRFQWCKSFAKSNKSSLLCFSMVWLNGNQEV